MNIPGIKTGDGYRIFFVHLTNNLKSNLWKFTITTENA